MGVTNLNPAERPPTLPSPADRLLPRNPLYLRFDLLGEGGEIYLTLALGSTCEQMRHRRNLERDSEHGRKQWNTFVV